MPTTTYPRPVFHGVNLGNWLLLERWIKPSLFSVAPEAGDEYSLCTALGSKAEAFMRRHRETYLTDKDFKWMADYGINAVRIPFGYWFIDPEPPFVGGIEALDHALDLCKKYRIAGVLDLHGAPGHQNPADHSGRKDYFQWHLNPAHRAHTVDILEAVAQRYRNHPGLGAISVLNEPWAEVPSAMLVEFYHQAYERIRRHISPQRAPIVVEAHPHFRLHEFHGKLQTLGCQNVITDIHPYQSFVDHFNRLDLHEHLAAPMAETYPRIAAAQQAGPLLVGEWSLAMGQQDKVFAPFPPHHQDLARRAFAAAQLALFEHTAGWFFWTYKTETNPVWSLRDCVDRSWFPPSLVSATPSGDSLQTPAAPAPKPSSKPTKKKKPPRRG